jgi:hypothetical protein
MNPVNFDQAIKKISDSSAVIFKENTFPDDSLYFLDLDGHKLEIHVGDWRTRVIAKKANPGDWENVQFFV